MGKSFYLPYVLCLISRLVNLDYAVVERSRNSITAQSFALASVYDTLRERREPHLPHLSYLPSSQWQLLPRPNHRSLHNSAQVKPMLLQLAR
jgi:hypothetical protein